MNFTSTFCLLILPFQTPVICCAGAENEMKMKKIKIEKIRVGIGDVFPLGISEHKRRQEYYILHEHVKAYLHGNLYLTSLMAKHHDIIAILKTNQDTFHPVVAFDPGRDRLLELDFTEANTELISPVLE